MENPTSTAKVIGRTSLPFLEQLVFYVELHFNLKQLRFTGEPMTQQTCLSCLNVNHVGM